MPSQIFTDFTIGADPEFGIFRNNRVIRAENMIRNADETDGFGFDGNGTIFELRPRQDYDPFKVVSSIHSILNGALNRHKSLFGYDWHSGSSFNGWPYGGHIHFGVTESKLNNLKAIDFGQLAKCFDKYLAIPSILVDKYSAVKSRNKEGYGMAGDYRAQSYGVEYRVCPSWLISPYISTAFLTLAKTVMYEIIHEKTSAKRVSEMVYPLDSDSNYHRNIFESTDRAEMKTHFNKFIWDDIKKMKLYQSYKPYIDLIYFLIKNKLTWITKTSMQENWGLFNPDLLPKAKSINMDVIWARYNNQENTF